MASTTSDFRKDIIAEANKILAIFSKKIESFLNDKFNIPVKLQLDEEIKHFQELKSIQVQAMKLKQEIENRRVMI